MTTRLLFVLFLSALCLAPGAAAPLALSSGWQLQDAAKVPDAGGALSLPGYKPARWYRATVPGTVLTSLVNDGVYPEPLYGENNRPDRIPESLCRTSYWYRTAFTVPKSYAGRHVWLHFDGINYVAEVWVNGHDVGAIRGAFARGLFDVTPYVVTGPGNAVAVQILPPPHPGVPVEQTQAAGVGPNGGETARDGPTFLCTIGWDWIPGIRDRDMGIWQGVSLSASGPVTIQDPFVTSDLPLPRLDEADLTVHATLRNVTGAAQVGVLTGTFGQTTFHAPVTLGPNETRTLTLTPATTPALHLLRPRLWWPNGYGPQNLYTLHLSFAIGGAASDASDTTFGVRKITYLVPGSDNLTLSVNGVPVFAKGGDWGMDEAMKRIPARRLDAQVRMHQQANYTIIRNWVGQSTSEAFYEACDKYGILLWDEFFQPNPSDGPNPDDDVLYLANVREKLLRFRSHPSIALWCARNEGDPPPVIDRGIQALIAELEPQRLYQRSSTSGHGVNSGGPYFWRTPREYYNYGEAFKTEIGSVSVPTLESVRGMMPEKDWGGINDDWAEHDLAGGAQGGDWYPKVLAARYGKVAGLEDFVRKAQLANYEAFRAMYEGRNAKLFHPSTGVITWMSNPAQPSFVWQLYGWDLEPNASLFAVRHACEPIHVQMNQTDWHVLIVNNTPQTLAGLTAKTSVYNLDGILAYTHSDAVTAAPSAATDLGAVAFPDGLSAVHFVRVQLFDSAKRLVSDGFYWRALPGHDDDFRALNDLPPVSLTASVKRHDTAGKCLLDLTLTNPTRRVALMAHVQLRRRRSGLRVLPVFYSDNYVSLLPAESRTITVEAASEDLAGDAPLLALDGWNVLAAPTGAALAVPVISNPNAGQVHAFVPARPVAVGSVNCGGPSIGPFAADVDFDGGSTADSAAPVNADVPNAAPAAIYQSERWGACTYTLPAKPLAAGRTYTVRLHFAESKFDAGQRRFNVDVNGRRVLSDFDICAQAGGKNRAVVKDVTGVMPDADGSVVIAFTRGSVDEPKVCGLQLLPTEAAK